MRSGKSSWRAACGTLALAFSSVLAISRGLHADEHALEFDGCPEDVYFIPASSTEAIYLFSVFLHTSERNADRVQGWTIGLAVEGAQIVPEENFGNPFGDPPTSSAIDVFVPVVRDDDGDPDTAPVAAGELNLLEGGCGTVEPAVLPGEPSIEGLVSHVTLDAPGGLTLPAATTVHALSVLLRVSAGSQVVLRLVDGLVGSEGPVENRIEGMSGPTVPVPGECAFEVRQDTRQVTFSVLPEAPQGPLVEEDGFLVHEATLRSGSRWIPCLLRLGTEGFPKYGPQAWSVSVRHDVGLSVTSPRNTERCRKLRRDPFEGVLVETTYDHDGDPGTPHVTGYGLDLGDAAFKTHLAAMGKDCGGTSHADEPGVIGAAVLNYTRYMTLTPNSEATMLRVEYNALVRPGLNPDLRIWFEDGLAAPDCSCPVDNSITVDGMTFDVTRYRGMILRLTGEGSWPTEYIRADANSDDRVDMSDAITILGFLFVHEPPVLECRASADTNQSWDLDISDAVHLLSYLFLAGSPPPEPFPDCGSEDVEGNPLTCGSSAACPER